MKTREQYLADATSWTHHEPHVEKAPPKVESPIKRYDFSREDTTDKGVNKNDVV